MNPDSESKVQKILELFSDGRYQVDPAAVAEAIIRRRRALDCESEGPWATSGEWRGPRVRGIVLVGSGPLSRIG